MKKTVFKLLVAVLIIGMLSGLAGCASLKKKFTRKKGSKKPKVYFQVKKYDIKPSPELYEKHYIFWINWHKELVEELGRNFKSDIRSSQEAIGNLEDMQALLVDEKAEALEPHIEDIRQAKLIIDRHNMTKQNETRIRNILNREYRSIKREFSPKKISKYIRSEWREYDEVPEN